MTTKVCTFPQCDRPHKAKGLCNGHHQQRTRGSELTPLRIYPEPGSLCSFPGCEKTNYAKQFCMGHWKQQSLKKPLTPLEKRDKGTWGQPYKNLGGYVLRSRYNVETGKKEDLLEHRRVMQEHLGRTLEPHETVHHINGQRDQNNIENLELWSSSQPYGQRVTDKVKWAKELLRQYDPGSLSERI